MESGARTAKKEGVDPTPTSARHSRGSRTIEELFAEFLKCYSPDAKAAPAVSRILRREIIPAWSLRDAKGITRGDIMRLLDKVEDRSGAPLRNRVADAIIRLFRFATELGAVDTSPAVGVRRLDKDGQGRSLTGEEIKAFWYGLEHAALIPSFIRPALRFLLVTGRTRVEVAGAARSEIDNDRALWRLPDIAGNGREILIPLPELALQIVADADEILTRISKEPSNRKTKMPFPSKSVRALFPSGHTGKAFEPATLKRALDNNPKMLGVATPSLYDLATTFESWHRDHHTPPEVLDALVKGAPSSMTDAFGQHNMKIQRDAMVGWCSWLQTVLS